MTKQTQQQVIKALLASIFVLAVYATYNTGYNAGKAIVETVLPEPEVQSMIYTPSAKPSESFISIARLGMGE